MSHGHHSKSSSECLKISHLLQSSHNWTTNIQLTSANSLLRTHDRSSRLPPQCLKPMVPLKNEWDVRESGWLPEVKAGWPHIQHTWAHFLLGYPANHCLAMTAFLPYSTWVQPLIHVWLLLLLHAPADHKLSTMFKHVSLTRKGNITSSSSLPTSCAISKMNWPPAPSGPSRLLTMESPEIRPLTLPLSPFLSFPAPGWWMLGYPLL